MEIGNIHIQVSITPEDVVCKETNFEILGQVTEYCLAWKSDVLEKKDLTAQLANVVQTYRDHNELEPHVPLQVGVWFETPIAEPIVNWTPFFKPELEVLQGGKQ